MNKIKAKVKSILKTRKRTFIFFAVLVILGIIFGSLFITILNESDKQMVTTRITEFFAEVKSNNDTDVLSALKNSLFSNVLSVIMIWLLGISIIGIPLIIVFIFIKTFIFGFSVGGIISVYNIKGIVLSIGYLFPHQFINITVLFILSLISFNLSINFLKNLLTKRTMDFKIWTGRYYKLLLLSLILMIASSLLEVFVSPFILKLVANLV